MKMALRPATGSSTIKGNLSRRDAGAVTAE